MYETPERDGNFPKEVPFGHISISQTTLVDRPLNSKDIVNRVLRDWGHSAPGGTGVYFY